MERIEHPTFETERKHLFEAIHLKYGYDFRNYSLKTMRRMLVQAMNRMDCPTLPALEDKILEHPKHFDDLVQSLTNPVSEMFRDPGYYLALREKVIPYLQTYPSVKVWVAGCSTGEEVYSLAILFQEENLLERVILYATDINARSLEKAERGTFALEAVRKAGEKYAKSGGKRTLSDYYRVDHESAIFDDVLKKNVIFTDHSLVTDAVFSEAHLVSCRNVLIYFDRELQDRALGLFHESLCKKGFLGLGSHETLQFSPHAKEFAALVKKERIFQKTS